MIVGLSVVAAVIIIGIAVFVALRSRAFLFTHWFAKGDRNAV